MELEWKVAIRIYGVDLYDEVENRFRDNKEKFMDFMNALTEYFIQGFDYVAPQSYFCIIMLERFFNIYLLFVINLFILLTHL
jgi:hypothetical protein